MPGFIVVPVEEVLPPELDVVLLDVDKMAEELQSSRSANIILLGAASPFLGIEMDKLEEGIRRIFGRKGEEIVETNLKALRAGRAAAEQTTK